MAKVSLYNKLANPMDDYKKVSNPFVNSINGKSFGTPVSGGYSKSKTSNKSSSGTNTGKYSIYRPEATSNNDSNDLEQAYLNSLAGGSVGGGYAGQPIDLSDILNSYTQSADAQKKTINDSAASQRQTLLTSLQRFQEETAKARKQQQTSYNSSRADLEGQAFMANRQAALNAAARGLGGSGLQQLAQIQNLINQSAATNELAQDNTTALQNIASALAKKEEDTTNAINNITTEAANKVNEIEANTTNLKEQLKYQEAIRAEEARQAASAAAASYAASNQSALNEYNLYKLQKQQEYDDLVNTTNSALYQALKTGQASMQTAYDTAKKSQKAAATQTAYNNALNALYSAYGPSGLPTNKTNVDTYASQLLSLYNSLV